MNGFIPVSEIQKARACIENIPRRAYPIAWAEGGNYVFIDEGGNGAVFFGGTTKSQTVNTLFTGQYRDTELATSAMPSGLDDFRGRHYSPALGRLMQPDPLGNFVADLENPQSRELYSYVWNNPLAYVDPTGLDVTQLGNCYSNTTIDPETGQTIYLGGPVCFQPETGTGSNPSTPPPTPSQPARPPAQQQKQCLNNFFNTKFGKTVQFLSPFR